MEATLHLQDYKGDSFTKMDKQDTDAQTHTRGRTFYKIFFKFPLLTSLLVLLLNVSWRECIWCRREAFSEGMCTPGISKCINYGFGQRAPPLFCAGM